ncbi:hypothetical protein NHF46_13500 [Arthrobacter alpinus]|nr:hypothetical protein [Arthrobacter alpinus]
MSSKQNLVPGFQQFTPRTGSTIIGDRLQFCAGAGAETVASTLITDLAELHGIQAVLSVSAPADTPMQGEGTDVVLSIDPTLADFAAIAEPLRAEAYTLEVGSGSFLLPPPSRGSIGPVAAFCS